ncbi:MAG: hydroxymethylbilane synthase, partial [Thalassolituus oleivorans]
KGLFTAELEEAIRAGTIDIAVHSLKDLPTASAEGIVVAAVLDRQDSRDALVSPGGQTLAELPAGSVVGTSSTRRAAQLLRARPDLTIRSIRGNVPTRVQKVRDGHYDAAVLAAAGLKRLGLAEAITEYLDFGIMLPAPGQGAIAVQCRAGDASVAVLLAAIDEPDARSTTTAERAFLSRLQAGCSSPVGARAWLSGGHVHLEGVVLSLDGADIIRVQGSRPDPEELGRILAEDALALGAEGLIGA